VTKQSEIFARITFATAVHHGASLRVIRWAAEQGCIDRMFPLDQGATLDLPQPVALAVVKTIDEIIKRNAWTAFDANVEALINLGFHAGIAAVAEHYKQQDSNLFTPQVE
jgi:hypothetical protein